MILQLDANFRHVHQCERQAVQETFPQTQNKGIGNKSLFASLRLTMEKQNGSQ